MFYSFWYLLYVLSSTPEILLGMIKFYSLLMKMLIYQTTIPNIARIFLV